MTQVAWLVCVEMHANHCRYGYVQSDRESTAYEAHYVLSRLHVFFDQNYDPTHIFSSRRVT